MEARFRVRVRRERERLKMSQADLAEMLSDMGLKGIYPTTIAKIESGERAVRIDEAAALSKVFEVSLDALVGRKPSIEVSDLGYQLRNLRDAAKGIHESVYRSMEVLNELLGELPTEFAYSDMVQRVGQDAGNQLLGASESLVALEDLAHELVRRQQGRQELSEEALLELDVPEE